MPAIRSGALARWSRGTSGIAAGTASSSRPSAASPDLPPRPTDARPRATGALGQPLPMPQPPQPGLRAIDIGGGCGGWIRTLAQRMPGRFAELAIGDSALAALHQARNHLPQQVKLFHLDCTNLGWKARWDVIFLLDVLEHLPDDAPAMREVARALAPGGVAFVTVPALRAFWSYNDVLIDNRRRYCRADFARLARAAGLVLLDSRYFMFFLSPLLVGSRWLLQPRLGGCRPPQAAILARTHRTPPWAINSLLSAVFAAETPLGHRFRFPWGTSLLGVFGKGSQRI